MQIGHHPRQKSGLLQVKGLGASFGCLDAGVKQAVAHAERAGGQVDCIRVDPIAGRCMTEDTSASTFKAIVVPPMIGCTEMVGPGLEGSCN